MISNSMLRNEVWKDVVGFEGLYMVSDRGHVVSVNYRGNTGKPHLMTLSLDRCGYQHLSLSKDGKGTNYFVHRLVAMAFIPNPLGLPQINHKSEVKTDNCVESLEWCDDLYNHRYGTCQQRSAEKRAKRVVQLTMQGEYVKTWPSMAEAALNGYQQGSISECCNGNRTCHFGSQWMFESDYDPSHTPTAVPVVRSVCQFDLNGNYIRTWVSANDAYKSGGFAASSIRKCCKGLVPQVKGYQWRYEDECDKRGIEGIQYVAAREVVQIDMDGNFVKTWPSIKAAATALGMSQESIRYCCNGNAESRKGHRWCYKDRYVRGDYKKLVVKERKTAVRQLTKSGDQVAVWESLSEARDKGGFSCSAISQCCHGKLKSHKGYRWEFV